MCIFIFSNSLLFQSFIFLLLKAPGKGFVLIEKHWRLDKPFWKYRPSKYTWNALFHIQNWWYQWFQNRIKHGILEKKMFEILISCNHSINSMIRNELNLFFSYIFKFLPQLKCIIMQFLDWWNVNIDDIQANSTRIFVKHNGKDDIF